MRQIEVYGVCRRPLAYDDINGIVLHSGIKNFLIRAVQAVYLVHKQDIPLAEVCQHCHKIARLLYRRAGRNTHVDAHLVCDDGGKRRLAESRRAVQQDVVKRFAAHFGRVYEHIQVVLRLLLADVFSYCLWAQ